MLCHQRTCLLLSFVFLLSFVRSLFVFISSLRRLRQSLAQTAQRPLNYVCFFGEAWRSFVILSLVLDLVLVVSCHLLPSHLFSRLLSVAECCLRYDNYSRPSNPFLVPLTKYLDRYATETMDYFLEKERLGKASFAGLLVRASEISRTVPSERRLAVQTLCSQSQLLSSDFQKAEIVHTVCVNLLCDCCSFRQRFGFVLSMFKQLI